MLNWKCQHQFSVHENFLETYFRVMKSVPMIRIYPQTVNVSLVCSIFFYQRETCETCQSYMLVKKQSVVNFFISRSVMPPPGREKRIMTSRAPSTCSCCGCWIWTHGSRIGVGNRISSIVTVINIYLTVFLVRKIICGGLLGRSHGGFQWWWARWFSWCTYPICGCLCLCETFKGCTLVPLI